MSALTRKTPLKRSPVRRRKAPQTSVGATSPQRKGKTRVGITKAKKRAWDAFSRYIRLRSALETTGTLSHAKCCTCGTYKEVKYMDCGHFIKRQHQAVRFSEMNCHTQCKRCNNFEQGSDTKYRLFLVDKYGEIKVLLLESEAKRTVKRSKFDLGQIAFYYKTEATRLAKEKGLKLW